MLVLQTQGRRQSPKVPFWEDGACIEDKYIIFTLLSHLRP